MLRRALALLMFAVSASRAAIIESAPLPASAAPFFAPAPAPPTLSVLSAAPLLSPLAPLAAAPSFPAAALTALPALPAAQSGPAAAKPASAESSAAETGRVWDGSSFPSADGSLDVAYKRRAGPDGTIPRVYAGGLGINESFDPLLGRPVAAALPEYFFWTRGHVPTGWTPTKSVLDADARDLARMIGVAARETGAAKVELALHSFGTVLFQRMVQLRAEPEVRAALKLLAGSRVVLLNGMTHYAGADGRMGAAVAPFAAALNATVRSLDAWDALGESMEAVARMNPFLAPQIRATLAVYRAERARVLAAVARPRAQALLRELSEPWTPDVDAYRAEMVRALERDRDDPSWQEAVVRRSDGALQLDFKASDARFLRRLGVGLEFVHALDDKLLSWDVARIFFERFGVKVPEKAPPAGTVLTDASGRFRATVVDGDHYYPLKRRDDLARRLDP